MGQLLQFDEARSGRVSVARKYDWREHYNEILRDIRDDVSEPLSLRVRVSQLLLQSGDCSARTLELAYGNSGRGVE